MGKLSPAKLTSSFAGALSSFVLAITESSDERFHTAPGEPRSAKITSVLIGTGNGGISIEESVYAILKGTQKVRKLLRAVVPNKKETVSVIIEELEFVELWQDTALQAARALNKVKSDTELRECFDCDNHVRERTGALRRLNRDEDPEWWHRLQILSDKDGGLRFNSITGLARTEVSLLAPQRTVLDKFVEETITDVHNDSETAKTLFELLLPNRLKEQVGERPKMVLLVDEKSAHYPWELLEDRFGASKLPQAVEFGVIRQLETKEKEFREHVNTTSDDTIFVVGDPVTNFIPLPGAAAEARLVARLFREHDFIVEDQIEKDALSIVRALHTTKYRILHLAGHGVHEERHDTGINMASELGGKSPPGKKPALISGMVIGEDIFLTPADVEQMRYVPELVFINCCHLGRTDKNKQDSPRKDRNKLAANVAAQFIRMGVKAVVAAGWAVVDEAAETFAREFYHAMLGGKPFGESVRLSREKTHSDHREFNTWGAYQCYGDPDYRLKVSVHTQADYYASKRKAPGHKGPDTPDVKHYIAPVEMVVDLGNLTSQVKSPGDKNLKYFQEELDQMIKRGEPSWLNRADVACALGLAFGEIEDFEKAIGYLNTAVAANTADLTVRAVEQRANFKTRWAVNLYQSQRQDPLGNKPAEVIKDAIRELELLRSFASTPERLSLSGSAYKRLAHISAGDDRKKALESMAACYKESHELAFRDGKGTLDTYSLLNWLVAEILNELYGEGSSKILSDKLLSEIDAWCDKARAAAAEKEKDAPDFWNSLVETEANMICALAHDSLDQAGQKIFTGYQHARDRGASPREFRSVIGHLEFLIKMISEAPNKGMLKKGLRALRELKGTLLALGE